MRISKKDLTIKELRGYGEADLPWGTSFHDIPSFSDENKAIYIGKYEIAKIWKRKDELYVVSKIDYSKFLSLDNAIKGLLRRLNN